MKTLTILTAFLIIGLSASAQTRVVKNAAGNYTSVKKAVDTSKMAQVAIFTDSKGNSYPVFKSVNGKLYYNKTSKTGNIYKAYIKEQ